MLQSESNKQTVSGRGCSFTRNGAAVVARGICFITFNHEGDNFLSNVGDIRATPHSDNVNDSGTIFDKPIEQMWL